MAVDMLNEHAHNIIRSSSLLAGDADGSLAKSVHYH